MGFRQAAVLAACCFFLGVLSVCFTVDYRVLFAPLGDETVRDGLEFYTTFFHSPPAIKALLHAVMGVGIIGLIGKVHKWDESAMYFDGSSLASFVFAIVVYISVGIPASRTIATPVPDVDTREDQIEALRILSAANVIMAVCLGAVLTLQAGETYARHIETKELAKAAEAEAKANANTEEKVESKKDQ
ncbi:hypothetical protein EIP91_010815 [Steccherinum ochraceum]|uniref:Shr3 amino acid permease chaperone n=1 Tax=Steccherinum ochraceum TaxID=92696 RepID=A0A4R0RYX5_9APHY|nr:hypothetical protein EIP91_010815 [Steccherinum ochraceum]